MTMTSTTNQTPDSTRERIAEIANGAMAGSTIAADILAEFVVIPRSELPKVTRNESTFEVSGTRYGTIWASDRSRREAYEQLAIAEEIDRRLGEIDAAADALAARRDELATELVAEAYGESEFDRKYVRLSAEMKKAVDRIIELEEAAA